MKTAGKLFLEWYNEYIKVNGSRPSNHDVNFYWTGGNLEKEKQQIIDSNNAGYKAHRKKLDQNAEDYYNETYNNS